MIRADFEEDEDDDAGSMLMLTGTQDDDDVDDDEEEDEDEDKHEVTVLALAAVAGGRIAGDSLGLASTFKWLMSSAEYLWQNEWFLVMRLTWAASDESWSVKSLE